MSRVTAPASKLSRSINTINTAANNQSHGAVLMPKYAELLKKTSTEADSHARSLTTTHRPTPQPKPSKSHVRPFMQTFAPISTASTTAAGNAATTIDATLMPFFLAPQTNNSSDPFASASQASLAELRMPLLPDSYATRHTTPEATDAPLSKPEISVVAAAPGNVLPASVLTEVEGMGVDGVELRFAHEPEVANSKREVGGSRMLRVS